MSTDPPADRVVQPMGQDGSSEAPTGLSGAISDGSGTSPDDAAALAAIVAAQPASASGVTEEQTLRVVELANKLVTLNPGKGDLAQRIMNIDKYAQGKYKGALSALSFSQTQELIEELEKTVLELTEAKV